MAMSEFSNGMGPVMVQSQTNVERSRLVVADDNQRILDTVVQILGSAFSIVKVVQLNSVKAISPW